MIRRLGSVCAALALVAAACGGGSGDDADAPATTGGGATTITITTGPGTPTTAGSGPVTGAAAAAGTATTTEPAPTSTSTTIPADCGGIDVLTVAAELTFTADGFLWAVDPGGRVRCLVESSGPASASIAWAPPGDRVVFADGEVAGTAGTVRSAGDIDGDVEGWTWPTGKRFLTTNGPTLTKVEADGSGAIDASVVDDHVAVAYHPDGQHFAVFGTGDVTFEELGDDDEIVETTVQQRALFVVRNGDPEPHLMIDPGEDSIVEAAFSADGTRLHILVDHGDSHHLHSFELPDMVHDFGDGERVLTAVPEDPEIIEPQFDSVAPLHHLVTDAADPDRVMFTQGVCGAGGAVELLDVTEGGYTIPVAPDLDAIPVGFLDEDTVVVAEVGPACTPTGLLASVDLTSGERRIIAVSATAAAIRTTPPELAFSLADVTIAGFA